MFLSFFTYYFYFLVNFNKKKSSLKGSVLVNTYW